MSLPARRIAGIFVRLNDMELRKERK